MASARQPRTLDTTASASVMHARTLRHELRRWLDEDVTAHAAGDITPTAYEAGRVDGVLHRSGHRQYRFDGLATRRAANDSSGASCDTSHSPRPRG